MASRVACPASATAPASGPTLISATPRRSPRNRSSTSASCASPRWTRSSNPRSNSWTRDSWPRACSRSSRLKCWQATKLATSLADNRSCSPTIFTALPVQPSNSSASHIRLRTVPGAGEVPEIPEVMLLARHRVPPAAEDLGRVIRARLAVRRPDAHRGPRVTAILLQDLGLVPEPAQLTPIARGHDERRSHRVLQRARRVDPGEFGGQADTAARQHRYQRGPDRLRAEVGQDEQGPVAGGGRVPEAVSQQGPAVRQLG